MRQYMREVRARQKLERERDEAANAAIARLSSMDAPSTAFLSIDDRLANLEAINADIHTLLEAVKAKYVARSRLLQCQAGRNLPPKAHNEMTVRKAKPAQCRR
jgi:hypothetical protein